MALARIKVEPMAVLVTGCAGFIGSTLAARLLAQGEAVLGVDCFSPYYDAALKKSNLTGLMGQAGFQFIEGDLVTMDLAPLLERVEAVFHTAGQPGVRGSWGAQFETYVRNNIMATQRLLEGIKIGGRAVKVIYSSSSSVYGNTDQLPITETALPRPYSPYGATKLAAEHLCMLYHANHGVPVISLRYFTVYGPRQRPDMAFHIFCKALVRDEPIRILGDGTQTRDFTFVEDIVAANLAAYRASLAGKIFNLGGGCRIDVNGVLEILGRISGKTPRVAYQEKMQGDVKDTWADTTQAQQKLGFAPQVPLAEGLRREWEWAREVYG